MTDFERQRKDLSQLIANGHAMLLYLKDLKSKKPEDKSKVRINFKENYEHWYSEAVAVIKQVLPDRLTDFTRSYKDPKIKKATEDDFSLSDYVIGFSYTTVHDLFPSHLSSFSPTVIVDTDGLALAKFSQQLSILEACETRFRSSLYDVRPSQDKSAKSYVNASRMAELRSIKSKDYDVSRLIRYCKELNDSYSRGNYLSTAMLVRAIIDHIPPIFGKKNYSEVANNHANKSIKSSLLHLDDSSRNISDAHLHIQIRAREVLPNSNQVDFSHELDVLLGEIYRILK